MAGSATTQASVAAITTWRTAYVDRCTASAMRPPATRRIVSLIAREMMNGFMTVLL